MISLRNKKYIVALFCFLAFALSACTGKAEKGVTIKNKESKEICIERITPLEKQYQFPNGDLFSIKQFDVNEKDASSAYSEELLLKGNQLTIYSQNYETTPSTWEKWEGENTHTRYPRTLYLQTNEESAVVGIAALYQKERPYHTITALKEKELPLVIEKTDNGYIIRANYEIETNSVGEFWYFKSQQEIINFETDGERFLPHDLYKTRRFSIDGYYYNTYPSYIPYDENGYFRNAANYTGAFLLNNDFGESATNWGYAMTKIAMANQNEQGFWETGPKSSWLETDFGIGHNFYDTRFSTDFSASLINGYNKYGDNSFLDSAKKYGDFLVGYAQKEGYVIIGEPEGILVPDYWNEEQTTKPHVSLNHQLAEINFLLELYKTTSVTEYFQSALSMLQGIHLTKNLWVGEDHNLHYALYYTGDANEMKDYPYLTYNDLYDCRRLLISLSLPTDTIDFLMTEKKIWMDANNVTGYKK